MITLEQARVALKQAMETQGPDFVYNPGGQGECWNVPMKSYPEGSPKRITGCLVGLTYPILGVAEKRYTEDNVGRGVMGILNDYLASVEVITYLLEAQMAQDQGMTWGDAYAAAERYADGVTTRPTQDVSD